MISVLPILLIIAIVLLVFRQRLLSYFPRGLKNKFPMVAGVLGCILLLYLVVNSVFVVRGDLRERNEDSVSSVNLPTMPVSVDDLASLDLDLHVVLLESNGSLLASDWKVQQWRVPAELGMDKFDIGGGWALSLDLYDEYNDSWGINYQLQSRLSNSSSNGGGLRHEKLTRPQLLDNDNSGRNSNITLLSIPKISGDRRLYFFLSKKGDALQSHEVNAPSGDLGDIQNVIQSMEIYSQYDQLSDVSPQGVRWIGWLGGSFALVMLAVAMAGCLFPWKYQYSLLGLFLFTVMASIALDRWRVNYAGEVSADLNSPVETRYLAIEHLRSSFFWRLSAQKLIDQSEWKGLDVMMNSEVH